MVTVLSHCRFLSNSFIEVFLELDDMLPASLYPLLASWVVGSDIWSCESIDSPARYPDQLMNATKMTALGQGIPCSHPSEGTVARATHPGWRTLGTDDDSCGNIGSRDLVGGIQDIFKHVGWTSETQTK